VTEPFARIVKAKQPRPGECAGLSFYIGTLCWATHYAHKDVLDKEANPKWQESADAINTAARKYAADKIREAAKAMYRSEMYDGHVDWLEKRADAVERGEV